MTYLDHASTVPLHPAAREVLLAASDEAWADPTRLYGSGRRARMLLDDARARVAAALGARPDEVTFTSSGTAAIVDGLAGVLAARARVGSHVVVSAVEHSAVLSVSPSATRVPVSRTGVVAASDVAAALRDDTAVVAVQHANQEVGSLQPVSSVAEVCAARGVPLFVDACASVGWVPVSLGGASVLAASAHKWGGPAGVGVLCVRKGTRWRSQRQEGFANVPAIVAAAAALEAVLASQSAEAARLSTLVELVRARAALIPDTEVLGEPRERLPHVVTFSCLYVDGEALVTALDRRGFAVNSGSSCASETGHPSHVLEAMGVLTHGNVRVSLGPSTTEAEVVAFCDAVREVVEDVRRQL